jgi:hypothetical protein
MLLKLVLLQNYDVLTAVPILPDLDNLKDQGYVEGESLNSLTLTAKGLELLEVVNFDIERLTTVMRSFWLGTKLGATTSINGVVARLQLFRRQFPKIDEESILLATSMYVDKCRVDHFKYIKTLGNFIIIHDGMGTYESELANYCESIEHEDGASEFRRA